MKELDINGLILQNESGERKNTVFKDGGKGRVNISGLGFEFRAGKRREK